MTLSTASLVEPMYQFNMLPADLNRYCCERRHDSYSSDLVMNVSYLDVDDSVLTI